MIGLTLIHSGALVSDGSAVNTGGGGGAVFLLTRAVSGLFSAWL